ncbi:unnamed protein product [Leptosia nina]|uniref:Ribosomal protein L15 n=1 Tax=Leptosia nina TaxID=320188 RepID=A0AAV1JJE6_9NEOP
MYSLKLHSIPLSRGNPDSARRGGQGGKLGRSRRAVKFKATRRGLQIVHRWRCVIRKYFACGVRRGARRRGGNKFSVQHTTRRCTRVSDTATHSTVS